MSTIEQVARAFARGDSASCHNARTDGHAYWLHGHAIAYREGDGITGDWCGWYTTTTANHLNHIINRFGGKRVGYASARDAGVSTFLIREVAP